MTVEIHTEVTVFAVESTYVYCCHLLCRAGSVGNSSLYHILSVILLSLSDVTLYCKPPGVSEHHEAFHDCVSIPGLFMFLLQVTLKDNLG